jgi:hypothetical protein
MDLQEQTRKHRKVISTPSPPEGKLLFQIEMYMKEPYKSYACFLYLYGTRVSEGIGIRRKKGVGPEKYVTEPIRKWDFAEQDGILYIKNIRIFKRKDRPYIDKYVLSLDPTEEPFIKILKDYIRSKQPEEVMWKFHRSTFWKKLNKATGLFPHKLRGMRATKDVNRYDLNIIELKKKHGWTQDSMPMKYVELADSDVIKKLQRKRREIE